MTDRSHLVRYLPQMAGRRILCVGDVMLDRFVRGAVTRVSPEAPIPVVRVEREDAMPGGAGNVAANVAGLGGRAHLVAVTGEDAEAKSLSAGFAAYPGIEPVLVADPARPTTLKTRYAASGQQLLRADREHTAPISGVVEEAVAAAVRAALPDADAVILSDYGKGVLTETVLRAVFAGAAGKDVIVDPAGRDYSRYRGAAMVSPNRAELENAAGHSCPGDGGVATAATALAGSCGLGALLVTRGAEGMTYAGAGAEAIHIPALHVREVFDVSGAGDTVVAVYALARAAGADETDAAALANAAAGVVVAKEGTAVIDDDGLAAMLHGTDLFASELKIRSRNHALEIVARWRDRGLRVGFTNGCFDLVHPGHIALFRQARAACDRLVVGLNSDDSVHRLKGGDRPIQSEAARAVVVASLEAVDLVVIFGEDTPLSLIEAVRPDVLVKGKDYAIDQVVGADVVQENGGRVLLADLADGYSTTGTIRRLAG